MKRTVAFIVFAVGLITVYDVYTLAVHGYETTISWVLYDKSHDWPIIPFVFGVLGGHLFFPNRAARKAGEVPTK